MPDNEIQFQPPVTLKAGQIQFVEACHPPLVAGGYSVRMTQLIKETQAAAVPWNSDPYASTLTFSVDAPRFTLDASAIHSVYPPVNAAGRFDNALPHVVFTRRTLPWERTLDGKAPEWGKPFLPWMGLLLFHEDELATNDARSLPIAGDGEDSLLFPQSKPNVLAPDVGQSGPKWQQEAWQYAGKSCLAIDLDAALFKAIAPRAEDLQYLAHVRQVDTGNKEVLGINDKGWFSLLMGNRLPEANKIHRALLVSLEGFQDRLRNDWTPAPGQKVRLAVLASWVFTCEGTNDFKSHMDLLNLDPATPARNRRQLPDSWLRLPWNSALKDDPPSPETIVNGAYGRGYTAVDHVTRQGEKTVSWYRGALTPLNYDKPAQIQEPVSSADELLRYDPDTGLFDATYAAAWQLGRLLALQNQSFAQALSRARKAIRTRAEALMRKDELAALCKSLALPHDTNNLEDAVAGGIANGVGEKVRNAVEGGSR